MINEQRFCIGTPAAPCLSFGGFLIAPQGPK
jgi:hypothetical protein